MAARGYPRARSSRTDSEPPARRAMPRRRREQARANRQEPAMDKDALTAWALANGWQMMGGHPSLTKPSAPKEAIVRMVLKATVVHIEAKKPAGKWEKVSGAA